MMHQVVQQDMTTMGCLHFLKTVSGGLVLQQKSGSACSCVLERGFEGRVEETNFACFSKIMLCVHNKDLILKSLIIVISFNVAMECWIINSCLVVYRLTY